LSTGYQDFQYLAGVSILNVAEGIEFTIKEVKGVVDINIESVAETVVFDVNVQGTVDVNIKSQEAEITITGTVDINAIASVVKIEPSEEAVFEIKPQAGVVFNISGDVNANITNETIDVNITNSSVTVVVQSGTIDANITNTSINVNVQNEVDVNITNASIDVNVKNSVLNVQVSGQASVSIDNASVYLNVKNEKITELRRTIANHGTTASYASSVLYRGKYFPHGARGFITKIYVKCKNTDSVDHSLTMYVSIAPGLPPLITKIVAVAAGFDGWFGIEINQLWSYDSIFIVIYNDDASLQIAYDTGTPYDAWSHPSDYYQLTPATLRYWIKISIYGQTSGDVPVSGTVNTINIPNRAAGTSGADVNVPGLTEVSLLTVEGMGTVHYVRVMTNLGYMNFNFYVDGELIAYGGLGYTLRVDDLYNFDPNQASEKVKWLLHDTSGMVFVAEWCIPLQFKRSFEIRAYNPDANTNNARVLYCVYDLIS